MPGITVHDGTSEVEFRRTDESVWSWLEGGLWEPPAYRGGVVLIPGQDGYFSPPEPFVPDQLALKLVSDINGGAAAALLALTDEINAVWAATQVQPREMRVYGPLYGIPDGDYRKLNVRWEGNASADWLTARQRLKVVARLVCIDNPPVWVPVSPP
jgi:hypothetical protein